MSRIRARRATARRRDAPQEDAAWWEEATLLLLARSGHRCEKCGHPLAGRLERHHRIRRRDGGDRLSNLAVLHPACHQWVTEHPAEARELGLIVSAFGVDPGTVPLWKGGVAWLLDDSGRQTRVS